MRRSILALIAALMLANCAGNGATPSVRPDAQLFPAIAPQAAATTAFTVSGRQILLSTNGGPAKAFTVKGVNYAPTQICSGSGSASSLSLSDTNQPIWSQDLPKMRQFGVNAVKIYGMAIGPDNKPYPIGKWLTAAYNNNQNPVYTILSIWLPPDVVGNAANPAAIKTLATQYYWIARTYGANPDVMGISIGGEWNYPQYVTNAATWTNGVNPIIAQAQQGLVDAGVGNKKILTTTLINDLNPDAAANSSIVQGQKNGFPRGAFVWGIDVYSGFTNVVSFVKKYTQRPMIFSEWGEPMAYHPQPKANPTLVREYPKPLPQPVLGWVRTNGTLIYKNSFGATRMNSGSFYFEWSDEYWKAYMNPTPQQLCTHSGGNNGTNPQPSTIFPSGFNDEGWYGLNSIAKNTPASKPNVMTARPTFNILKNVWSGY